MENVSFTNEEEIKAFSDNKSRRSSSPLELPDKKCYRELFRLCQKDAKSATREGKKVRNSLVTLIYRQNQDRLYYLNRGG